MKKNKKLIFKIIGLLLVLAIGIFVWSKKMSPTKVALVNFQSFQASNVVLSNKESFIKYETVELEDLDKLEQYDFILGMGMGMRLTEEQRAQMEKASEKIPTYFFMVTAPENDFNNLSSVQDEKVSAYLSGGTRENYQNLARYIRREIDGKTLFVEAPLEPKKSKDNVLFHLDEEVAFEKVKDYENYLKKNKIYKENLPKVVLFSGIHSPYGGNKQHLDSMIVSLQNSGLNVYPVASFGKRLEFLKEISPDAVVYLSHGRLKMGDSEAVVEWLKEKNVPIFAPVSVLQLEEDWLKDKMGMFGGFMGQTIVMPELDGAIYPYVVIAQEKSDEGLFAFKTIPDRLQKFTKIVNNFIQLKKQPTKDKKVAIYYFKGAGSQALVGQGLELAPSLYNVLKRMKAEGYNVDNLPETFDEFQEMLHQRGGVFPANAEGTFQRFVKEGNPALVEENVYQSWLKKTLPEESYQEITKQYGQGVGDYMTVNKDGKSYLAVAKLQFGNVVVLPQPMAALGKDDFTVTHGVKEAPTHAYIGSYLWVQNEFKADALVHFGTHGSLEFTPEKQVALSGRDWADMAVGTIPHFYYYTIGNIGESVMAKRRAYATTVSYLTPAFTESDMRNHFRQLMDNIRNYFNVPEIQKPQASLSIKKVAVQMGLHLDLRLDGDLKKPYSEEDIGKLENFAEEVSTEKINGQLYTMGVPYSLEQLNSTVLAIGTDPLAYSLATLDKYRGRVTEKELKNKVFFTQKYLKPAKALVNKILSGQKITPEFIASVAGISVEEIEKSRNIIFPPKEMPYFVKKEMEKKMKGEELSDVEKQLKAGKIPDGMPEFVAKRLMEKVKRGERLGSHSSKSTKKKEARSEPEKPKISREVKDKARAILEIEETLNNIVSYKESLIISPELELKSFLNALAGGYVAPSSGGDPIANSKAIPTGKNLYSINAETTPSEAAWDRGVLLVKNTIEDYQKRHNGEYPKKIAYTFWSSEFIETEGVTIAQVLYMLGVEPVRDTYGRITDVRLIPAKDLGRPRIDVVIQTSGQFRDLAASRLFLLTKAIELASSAKDEGYENLVNKGSNDIERELVKKGVSPKDAREMSQQRIFGGVNGNYGTAIQEMVTSSDKWESDKEISETYMHNMGAVYGKEKEWGNHQKELFRAALQNTDVIIQPRQSNTWGALSLDHVYEFMGGMNTAIRNVTGKDPDAYLADYRNHNNMKMQELKEAIGVEARATIFNPKYIKETISGGESSASKLMEIVTNTFGWEATRPEAIDDEFWNKIYETYIEDKDNLGVKNFFKKESPAALQEITAIMLETTRKGMWKANQQQIQKLTDLHVELVKEFGAEPGGFSGGNKKLQEYIASKTNPQDAKVYKNQLQKMSKGDTSPSEQQDGKVLKKEEINKESQQKDSLNGWFIGGAVIIVLIGLAFFLKKRRQ